MRSRSALYTEDVGVRLGIFGVLLAAAAGASLRSMYHRPVRFVLLFALGVLAWTMIEYLLHRLAFHGFAPHCEHHAAPTDPVFIVSPLWLSLLASAVLLAAFSLAAGSLAAGASILAGVIAGYLAYELIHLRIHSPAAGGPILRALRKRHYYHHFANDQVCYGVTSPFWDWVFRSVPSAAEEPEARSRMV
jgi:sterol desaturase/sphingolipid hydroxylase (fatty acid hydroxylase superfamily)